MSKGTPNQEAVAAAIADLNADVFTVQEIQHTKVFELVLRAVSESTGRSYVSALEPSCRGKKKKLGIVYDRNRVELLDTLPLTRGNACPDGQAPANLAVLRPHGGKPFVLVAVHLDAFDEQIGNRRRQWAWLLDILPTLEAKYAAPVIVAGDFNSSDFLANKHDERGFIDRALEAHGLQLPTRDLKCSAYWKPKRRYESGLLDHVLAPRGLDLRNAQALGMCELHSCAVLDEPPTAYTTVSDHCPIRVELRR